MEYSVIKSSIDELPRIALHAIPEDHEIWETTDNRATIKVTCRKLDLNHGQTAEVVGLTISGPLEERQRVMSEFEDVYGTPAIFDIDPGDGIAVAMWTVN